MATPSGIQWRYTAMKVRIGPFDAAVVLPPWLIFLLHVKMWTAFLAISVTIVMWLVELFFEKPLSTVWRSIRSNMAGDRRPAKPWWKENSL